MGTPSWQVIRVAILRNLQLRFCLSLRSQGRIWQPCRSKASRTIAMDVLFQIVNCRQLSARFHSTDSASSVLLWTPEEIGHRRNWSVGVIADAQASAEQRRRHHLDRDAGPRAAPWLPCQRWLESFCRRGIGADPISHQRIGAGRQMVGHGSEPRRHGRRRRTGAPNPSIRADYWTTRAIQQRAAALAHGSKSHLCDCRMYAAE